ncbi:MAG: hypothetical protein JSU87_02310 [Gemmatimonadota bacterium]|nr:MAG: hypothetical protein JSU87_02310 [Gemmatimonadota bacterium]
MEVRRDDSGGRGAAIRLAAYSFLILFFELALIRYLPATVRFFSYYINLVLIATFVGMGAGLLAVRQVDRLRWAFPVLALLVVALARRLADVPVIAPQDPDEFLWANFYDTSEAAVALGLVPTVGVLFAACAVFFVPLGAMLGEEFRRFRSLVAYSIDIAGSLLGIICFGLISYAGWPPWSWFALGLAVLAVVSLQRLRYSAATAAFGVAVVALLLTAQSPTERWSPYYRVDWREAREAGYAVNVNGSMHLSILDLSEDGAQSDPWVQGAKLSYLAPYQTAGDTVLVLGAGAGNDVALLLDMGVEHVDAVEIDPVIAEMGRGLHFQRPYLDPRVKVRITDARAFLKSTARRYDLVIFGTLDSQTLLSGLSSLRLDNYVYTLEALRSARALLSPGGRLVMYHMSPREDIAAKIFQTLAIACGRPPIVHHWQPHLLFNFAFVCENSVVQAPRLQTVEYRLRFPITFQAGGERERMEVVNESRLAGYPDYLLQDVEIPSDDWPYLYLRRRTLPAVYMEGLALVLLFSVLLVALAGGRQVRGAADHQMFLLGLGFLLLETKSVTEMSLLFGSTWGVNLLVFSSILLMILLANWLVLARGNVSLRPVLLALLASLIAGYAIPVRALVGSSATLEWILGGLFLALPLFFAALTFATLFKERQNSVRALGYNLFGAAVGGVLEYSVMVLGVKALYLIAAAAYGLLWFSLSRSGRGALAGRIAGPTSGPLSSADHM